jgi:predicted transcriptional regulator
MKKTDVRLSKFELQIMDMIWDKGEAAIRELHETLPEKGRPAYTTVQTIVNRLEEKGAVERSRKIGNAHLYRPLISRKSIYSRLVDDVLELFGGSPEPLMAELVDSGRVSLEDLKELEKAIKRRKKASGGER